MKRTLNTLILIILLPVLGYSQAPEGMNYQAVARDGAGEPLQNQVITVVFEIRQSSATGTDVYKETHSATTNQFGLFTLEVGSGTVLGGAFNTISWGTDSYYLYVEIDGDPMGSSQLLSVPYALYSKQSANGPTGPQGPPGVGINWLGTFAAAPGTPALNDAYYDSTLGQSFIWDGASWNIMAQDGTSGAFTAGPGISIISGVISNRGDLDSLNELQTITRSGGFITLSDGGGSVLDSVIDADADPNNERITTFALNATSDSLIIVEAGVGHAFPLSQLNDGDWARGIGNDVFNFTDSVGIGTNNPKSPLQIGNWMHGFTFTMPGPEQYSVISYNAHPNGGTIKNTNGGFSGINFIGHDNTTPTWGVQLYPTQPAGADVVSISPVGFMHLKTRGLGIHKDTPDAALDIQPHDTSGIILRPAPSGNPADLLFEDTQGFLVGLRAPLSTTGSYTMSLPTSLPSATGAPLVSDVSGNLSWGLPAAKNIILDDDGDTYVDVEQTTNENIIHFGLAGTEHFIMDGPHLFVLNNGTSTFYGDNAGAVSTGISTTAIGFHALQSSTSGQHNTAIGANSMITNTTTSYNTAVGSQSLQNGGGEYNVGIGWRTLMSSTGIHNTAVGTQAMQQLTTGQDNVAVGMQAGLSTTTGNENVAIGSFALNSNVTGSTNVAVGREALRFSTGNANTATGFRAGQNITTGVFNVVSGYEALRFNNIGNRNTAIGGAALQNATGHNNTSVGADAGVTLVNGDDNTFIGKSADVTNAALSNATAIGANAVVAQSNSLILGNNANVGIGTSSPAEKLHVSASNSIAARFESSSAPGAVVDIDANTGTQAAVRFAQGGSSRGGLLYDSGTGNIHMYAFGATANNGIHLNTSSNNVGIGTNNPNYRLHVVGTGLISSTVHLGSATPATTNAKVSVWGAGWSNAFKVWDASNVQIMVAETGGDVGIGNVNPAFDLQLAANSAAKPTTNTWTVISDGRLKKDVKPFDGGLSDVLKIEPVWFTYNGKADIPQETGVGVIAQDIQKIAPYMVTEWEYKPVGAEDDVEGESYLGVDNGAMTYMLINAVKEQQKLIEDLLKKQDALEAEIQKLKNK